MSGSCTFMKTRTAIQLTSAEPSFKSSQLYAIMKTMMMMMMTVNCFGFKLNEGYSIIRQLGLGNPSFNG